ncbi:MAG: hypothetical protein HW406_61 [Candidatus Brocadiaceae bacterium]|nr:hypothetical protein [Candidatus Brocadiaceae bacterium]
MSSIVYITAQTPFGSQETFVLTEMLALKKSGVNLLIIPRDTSKILFHKKATPLLENTLCIPWFNLRIITESVKFIGSYPSSFLKLIKDVVIKARSVKIALKNLMVIPKSIYLVKILKEHPIAHIHAHWASTTATIAYIVSRFTNIPWSFTAHRWDIPEDNLLKEKVKTASFVRCIDENGRKEMLEIIKDNTLDKKILVLHMGVDIVDFDNKNNGLSEIFTFICPANFESKKGHKYLFEACKMLSSKNIKYKCRIAGDGCLENDLKRLVKDMELSDNVQFLGRLSHEKLFGMYAKGEVNAVILPSIKADDGQKEGIPVALIEAMACKIPVISTNTGGIPELIGDGCGVMVEERNSEAIASAIERLMNSKMFYRELVEKGMLQVKTNFDVESIANKLTTLFLQENTF